MKKLPNGFKTWVSLYDFLIEKGLRRNQSIAFDTFDYFTKTTEKYKVSMATVERNAWNELQKLRLTEFHTMGAIVSWYNPNPNDKKIEWAKELLFHLKIEENKYE